MSENTRNTEHTPVKEYIIIGLLAGVMGMTILVRLALDSARTPVRHVPAQTDIETGRIDLNKATAEELGRLPGIGPALAQDIIEYRTARGPFSSTEEIKNIKGIGEKTYQRLSGLLQVSP